MVKITQTTYSYHFSTMPNHCPRLLPRFDPPKSHNCGRLYFQRHLQQYLSSHMLFLQCSRGEVGSMLPPLESGQGRLGLMAEVTPRGFPGQLIECRAASAVLTGIFLLEHWAAGEST